MHVSFYSICQGIPDLVYQFVPEWIAQNILVNLLCNGSEIYQVM